MGKFADKVRHMPIPSEENNKLGFTERDFIEEVLVGKKSFEEFMQERKIVKGTSRQHLFYRMVQQVMADRDMIHKGVWKAVGSTLTGNKQLMQRLKTVLRERFSSHDLSYELAISMLSDTREESERLVTEIQLENLALTEKALEQSKRPKK